MKRIARNNRRFFLNIFTAALVAYGLAALPPFGVALYRNELTAAYCLGIVSGICIIGSIIVRHFVDLNSDNVRPRINYMTVIFTWLILTGITTVIYYIGCGCGSLSGSFFDAAASLTTTGALNLSADVIPVSLLLFRSILNWLGGIGFILIAVSLLAGHGFSGLALVSIEVPGPEFLTTSANFKHIYQRIFYVYSGLTLAHFLLLLIAGMDPFDSVLTAFSNISTSGLQHLDHGVITQLSLPLKVIITVFSFLGSCNITFIVILLSRKFRSLLKESETILYVLRILIITIIISAIMLAGMRTFDISVIGDVLMQTVSYLSTSGYTVTDSGSWPLLCQAIIVIEVFFGACAASTGGGIKTSRARIATRTISFGMFRHIHPKSVRPVMFKGKALTIDQLTSSNIFLGLFMSFYIIGAVLISLGSKECSIVDSLLYSQALITNTGTPAAAPELSMAITQFSPFTRFFMAIEMLAGRLEIYPILMLFTRSFWKSDSNR